MHGRKKYFTEQEFCYQVLDFILKTVPPFTIMDELEKYSQLLFRRGTPANEHIALSTAALDLSNNPSSLPQKPFVFVLFLTKQH